LPAVQDGFIWLEIIGVVTLLISVYYNPRAAMTMYLRDGDTGMDRESWPDLIWGLIALTMVTLSIVPVRIQGSSDKVVPVRVVISQSCS
jgi:NADH:ubiquinone oxidoreductase subunit 2 (subunit N)